MKILERAIMPNGTEIQLEDWNKGSVYNNVNN